ncbi:hypothetical protein TthSNM76_23320 (plasmid) [Thermus thermophilus]|nr:hypothetical protein TthSNM76_23320 [Thermus thermophilus]
MEAPLEQVPVVVLTGPRQAGKTTLALEVPGGAPWRGRGADPKGVNEVWWVAHTYNVIP